MHSSMTTNESKSIADVFPSLRRMRWWVTASCLLMVGPGVLAQPEPIEQPNTAAPAPYVINLGDFAKGDGTDDTEAIQSIFDSIHMGRPGVGIPDMGAKVYVPRPRKAYCISKTIRIVDKWNTSIICETPVWGSSAGPAPHYFRWIGPDGGTMFEFRNCKGMNVQNLSMTGLDGNSLEEFIAAVNPKPLGRLTKGVTGIRLGPETQQGYQTSMTFDSLRISNVDVAVRLGVYADNGPDVRELSFRMAILGPFSSYGVIAASGNLANVTFETVSTTGAKGAKAAFLVNGGELLLLNFNGVGRRADPDGAEVIINAGGIHIIKAWSEWDGPFLKTGGGVPEWQEKTSGSVNYPVILEGIRHYHGSMPGENYPISVDYNRPVPLHLIGCSFWGGVKLGAESQACVIDHGTVFINKDSLGFTGEGITRYGRVIHVGTRHPDNDRILEPYVVDRRSTPGTGPPVDGVWQRGDGIINIEPDPDLPEKAWRGWVCIEAGEPGTWRPYGAIGK